VVLLRDGEELIDAMQEPVRVLLVREIVQEHAHRVHADGLRPPEFEIDPRRIERRGLPHLQFVDRCRGDVIGADQETLARVPVVRLLLGPAPCRGGGHRRRAAHHHHHQPQCGVPYRHGRALYRRQGSGNSTVTGGRR
jgi:hypothetical protein